MGADIPTFDDTVSIPIQGTKQKGFTAIYRSPFALQGPISIFDPKILTMKDVIYQSLQKYKNKQFIGQIKIKPIQKDGKIKQQRQLLKFTFAQVVQMAQKIGSFLVNNKLGFQQPVNKMKLIGIYSKNRYEWAVADIATMLYGYTFAPLYQTLGIQNLTYCLQHSEITTLFVTAQTIKTLLKLKGHGDLRNLISFDPLSQQIVQQAQTQQFKIIYLSDILKQTKIINHRQIKVSPQDCLTFSYTSGTTGPPKGAMISHGNFVAFIGGIKNHEVQGFTSQDSYVSFLPLPHLLQRCVFLTILQAGGFMAFYNGDILKFKDDMAFVKPTLFIAVPRILNRIVEQVQKQFSQLTGFKSWLVKKAISAKINYLRQYGDYQYPLYDKLVFSKVQKAFGGRIKLMVTGSAPIKKHTYQMMKILMGCPLYQAYGQTQNTAAAFAQTKFVKTPGNVGGVLTGMQFKLNDIQQMNYTSNDKNQKGQPTPRGQIWLRGPVVFLGYYKDAQKTKQHITQQGWLKTGDIGQLQPQTNALKIIDRKKNIFKLQQGQYIAAQKVQAIYMKYQLIQQAYLHGQSTQNYAIAVIVPNKNKLLQYAQNNGINGTYQQICDNKKIRQLLCKQLDKIGRQNGLMSFQQAKNIYIEKENFIARGIVSSTMKLQRFAGKKYYEKEIKNMYAEGPLLNK